MICEIWMHWTNRSEIDEEVDGQLVCTIFRHKRQSKEDSCSFWFEPSRTQYKYVDQFYDWVFLGLHMRCLSETVCSFLHNWTSDLVTSIFGVRGHSADLSDMKMVRMLVMMMLLVMVMVISPPHMTEAHWNMPSVVFSYKRPGEDHQLKQDKNIRKFKFETGFGLRPYEYWH